MDDEGSHTDFLYGSAWNVNGTGIYARRNAAVPDKTTVIRQRKIGTGFTPGADLPAWRIPTHLRLDCVAHRLVFRLDHSREELDDLVDQLLFLREQVLRLVEHFVLLRLVGARAGGLRAL